MSVGDNFKPWSCLWCPMSDLNEIAPLDVLMRLDVIERQVREADLSGISWDREFPDDLNLTALLSAVTATQTKVAHHGRELVVFMMGLGRLVFLARKLPEQDWAATEYENYSDWMRRSDTGGRREQTRYTALRLYTAFSDRPMEEIQDSTIGNLSQAAGIIKRRDDLSPQQRAKVVELASKSTQEFRSGLVEAGIVPAGEESERVIEIKGFVADCDHIEEWLRSDEVRKLGPNDAARLVCAINELDSTGPSAVQASLLLQEIAGAPEISDDLWSRIQAWAKAAVRQPESNV